jgi:PAS domain S-box-containing protein
MPQPSSEESTLFGMFVEQSHDHAVLLVGLDGRILGWNPGAERIFGYRPDEILGEPLERLFVPEDKERGMPAIEMEVATRQGVSEDDRWQLRRDGSRFWAVGALVALRDAEGALVAYAKVLRNRTDLKEQIETLRNHAAALEQGARRKDTFISTLSHELRNPLAPLTNAVQLIRMSAGNGAEIEYPLKVIERQTELLRRLVDDLLDVSRIGAGKIEMHRRRLVLQDVVRAAAEDARAIVDERRHELQLILAPEPLTLLADRDRLHQVFVNLVNNAAKYTPPGGRIAVAVMAEGHEAVVRVSDNGLGIAHEMLPRIFELFTQVEASRAFAGGGLGIGLSLVRDLVALHGGSVQARSDGVGKGSVFMVRLPLGAGDEAERAS